MYPQDWPKEGPIDLQVHDLPHASSSTEWWYMNSHLVDEDDREYSLFASFFRIVTGRDPQTQAPLYAHSLTWALIDLTEEQYYALSLVDPKAPELGKERIKRGEGTKDHRLRRAMGEILDKGKVPYPDECMKEPAKVALDRLALDFQGNRYTKQSEGRYLLELHNQHNNAGCTLTFQLEKPAIRHGDHGVVKGKAGEDMFYYFIPRCTVTGTLTIKGKEVRIKHASGWYDHEFGAPLAAKEDSPKDADASEESTTSSELKKFATEDVAWNWASVQFEDGYEITAYDLVREEDGHTMGRFCVEIDPQGNSRTTERFQLVPLTPLDETWCSTRTFHKYPTDWKLEIPDFGYDLRLQAKFADQEFITLISKPAFWEGRIQANGTREGQPVKGPGFVERSGFQILNNLDDFFSAVGEQTRKSVRALLPDHPTHEQVRDLMASADREDLMPGVDREQFARTLIKPVREIADRGGKSWRSYAALACCDVVGGDSRHYARWLAMPELMHVGSLIIDDVQDRSTWRRGGSTCHIIYGEPLAINAGTACYFMGQKLIVNKNNTPEEQIRLYDLYFQALRAGHAGQAMDIEGPADLMPAAVQSGDCEALVQRVLAIHRLKTAAPAGALARMGAVAGKGSEIQIETLGQYFEAVGLAFQIIDDVLNLRGFKRSLKSHGEDIKHGKITMPVAQAMGVMTPEDRVWLWETIQSKPQDDETVGACIEKIDAYGILDACVTQASELVERAWEKLDPIVEDSLQKLMLRAFSWYVLERHY